MKGPQHRGPRHLGGYRQRRSRPTHNQLQLALTFARKGCIANLDVTRNIRKHTPNRRNLRIHHVHKLDIPITRSRPVLNLIAQTTLPVRANVFGVHSVAFEGFEEGESVFVADGEGGDFREVAAFDAGGVFVGGVLEGRQRISATCECTMQWVFTHARTA